MRERNLPTKRIRLFGKFVAVVWPVRKQVQQVRKSVIEHDGQQNNHIEIVRLEGKPFIDFLWIRNEGTECEGDESSVSGGLSLREANQLATELQEAVCFLASLPNHC